MSVTTREELFNEELYGLVQRTNVSPLDTIGTAEVYVKDETVQSPGSFKLRGPMTKLWLAEQVNDERLSNGIYTGSAGNAGQGTALAATYKGYDSYIYLPKNAAPSKVEAITRFGGTVRFVDGSVDDALEQAQKDCTNANGLFVHPFDDRDVIAGNATLGHEIADESIDFETAFVPVGGGGLLAGVCQALDARGSLTRVYGVQLQGSDAFAQSIEARQPVSLSEVNNLSDGTAVRQAGALTLQTVLQSQSFERMVTVTNRELACALVELEVLSGTVAEMAGGLSFAGLRKHLRQNPKNTGNHLTLVTGRHRDEARFAELMKA